MNSSYNVGGEKLDMETKECRVATNRLLTYMDHPDSSSTELEAVLHHFRGCSFCQRHIGYLVRALNIKEEDSLTCSDCEELLPEYFQAEAEGQAGGARWQPVSRHLATCPHCAAAYATLTDLDALAFAERGVEPPSYPVPDLSFLSEKKIGSPPPPLFWHLDELGRLIIQFSAEFLRTWQTPAYGAAGLKTLGSKMLGPIRMQAHTDLEAAVTVEQQRNDPTFCLVTVQVNIPSRGGWPNLANIEVTLKQGPHPLATQLTDPYGEAIFERIATADLAQITVEIMFRPS